MMTFVENNREHHPVVVRKKNGKKCVTKSVENIWGAVASSWKLFEYIEWTTVTTYCLCDREFKSASTMLYPFLNQKKFKH